MAPHIISIQSTYIRYKGLHTHTHTHTHTYVTSMPHTHTHTHTHTLSLSLSAMFIYYIFWEQVKQNNTIISQYLRPIADFSPVLNTGLNLQNTSSKLAVHANPASAGVIIISTTTSVPLPALVWLLKIKAIINRKT